MKSAAASIDLRAVAQRRAARYVVKLLLAVVLVAWLVRREGWVKVQNTLAGVDLGWFALAVLAYLVGQSLCAWKWGVLARALGFRRPFRFYWVNYMGAMFPSLFLPTSVGGDVYRAIALARSPDTNDRSGATISVLADRGTGLLALVWVAALAAAVSPSFRLPEAARSGLYGLCAALTAAFIVPFFWRPGFVERGFPARVVACWRAPNELLLALGAAFLFQLLVCATYVVVGLALQVNVDPRYYFLICPIASLAAMSPFTIAGLGERTLALVFLFRLVGVGDDRGLAFGFGWSALVMVASLFGGGVLLAAEPGGKPAEVEGGG